MDTNAPNQPPEDEGWIYDSRQVYGSRQATATPAPTAYSHPGGPSQLVVQPPHESYPVPTQPTFFAAGPPSQQLIGALQPEIYPASAQTRLVQPVPLHTGPFPTTQPTVLAPTQPPVAQLQGNDPDRRVRKRRREASPEASDSAPARPVLHAGALTNSASHNLASTLSSATQNIAEAAMRGLAHLRALAGENRTQILDIQHPPEDPAQEEVLDEIYSTDGRDGTPVNLAKMYTLIDRLLSKQDEMSKTIEQLQGSLAGPRRIPELQGGLAGPGSIPESQEASAYTSPPEPPQDPVWDQTIPCILPAGRHARAARHTELLATIREVMLKLLKIPSLKKGGVLPAPPLPAVRVPTRENFSLRWDETEKSQFNRIAAGILVEEITDSLSDKLTAAEVKQLPKMIQQHIRYLCRRYKNENRVDAEEFNARRLKNCAADSRKRRLFETRMRVIDRFPVSLGKHRQLMVHLGVSGMSSDEEDEQNPQVFKICRRRELSTQVAQLKSNLDYVYALYYKGPGSKGSQLHHRVPSELFATRPFSISSLPITCMNRGWLSELSDAEKEFYRFQPHRYDYSFPEELFVQPNDSRTLARALSADPDM